MTLIKFSVIIELVEQYLWKTQESTKKELGKNFQGNYCVEYLFFLLGFNISSKQEIFPAPSGSRDLLEYF